MDIDRIARLRQRLQALAAGATSSPGRTLSLVHAQVLADRLERAQGALARELAERLERQIGVLEHLVDAAPADTATGETSATALPALCERIEAEQSGRPGLDVLLEQARQHWDALHAERQLQQSLAPASQEAGPLNSTALARRALAQLRRTSPGYLRHFLAHADLLVGLDAVLAHAPRDGAGKQAPARRRPSRPRR